MRLFKKKDSRHSLLGVDIGTGGLKLAEVAMEHGRGQLMTYVYTEPNDRPAAYSVDEPERLADLVKNVYAVCGATAKKVICSLPQHLVFDAVITVAANKDVQTFRRRVENEAAKLAPRPLSEMILDVTPLDDGKSPQRRVLVTGAPKVLIQKYVETFKRLKLSLVAVETEAFALTRSLVGRDLSTVLLIDLGAHRTNLHVVEKGVPVLSRSVNVGGAAVTERLAEQLSMPIKDAEQIKLDLSRQSAGEPPPAVQTILQPILHEVAYLNRLLTERSAAEAIRVEKVILSGGSSSLPGLAVLLTSKLNINVYVGNPFARLLTPSALKPVLDEIGPRLAIAVGLAMRETNEKSSL